MVGGGVIGRSIAWKAAQTGASVAVVDDDAGRAASVAAAGLLAPVTEAHYGEEALLRLNLASSDLYPSFIDELQDASGIDAGYRRCGTVMVARDADDNAALQDLFDFQVELALDVERLRRRDCLEVEPGLAPNVRGGILVAGDHQIDNRALLDALAGACENAGVQQIRGRADAIVAERDRVRGVRLQDGDEVACGTVVVAAGCWSSELVPLPVRPVKGQLLQLRGPAEPPLLDHNVRGIDVYLVPRADGRVVVGATVEEKGFDAPSTAGEVYELLRDGLELVPGLRELEVTEMVVGFRPGTPDNAPLIGPSQIEGVVVATGHFRNGILLAPITADCIARLIATDAVPDEIAPFAPARFREKVGA